MSRGHTLSPDIRRRDPMDLPGSWLLFDRQCSRFLASRGIAMPSLHEQREQEWRDRQKRLSRVRRASRIEAIAEEIEKGWAG